MQTFLPIATTDFSQVAKVLDNKRLHKQALEAWQILMVITKLDPLGNHREPKGWVNHPAVKMWQGHELSLLSYIRAMVAEWKERGYKSTIEDKARNTFDVAKANNQLSWSSNLHPDWLVRKPIVNEMASAHRQALLVKDYAWYHQFGWPEDTGVAPTEYDYVWPV